MNERIKELAEHANYLATEKEFPYDEDWFYLYNKKFAELIVRECIDTVSDCTVEYCTRPQIVSEIKQHFGVEE
jgi:hypothetical protein